MRRISLFILIISLASISLDVLAQRDPLPFQGEAQTQLLHTYKINKFSDLAEEMSKVNGSTGDTVYYYVNKAGLVKKVSDSKTQQMWTIILKKCPSCIDEAREMHIRIWQVTIMDGGKLKMFVKGKPIP